METDTSPASDAKGRGETVRRGERKRIAGTGEGEEGSTTSIPCSEIGPSLPEVGLRYFDRRKQYFHGTSEKRRAPPAISQEVADKPSPRLQSELSTN